jgi:hypothetical protein
MLQDGATGIEGEEKEEEEEEDCNEVVPFLKVEFYIKYSYDKYVFICNYNFIKELQYD